MGCPCFHQISFQNQKTTKKHAASAIFFWRSACFRTPRSPNWETNFRMRSTTPLNVVAGRGQRAGNRSCHCLGQHAHAKGLAMACSWFHMDCSSVISCGWTSSKSSEGALTALERPSICGTLAKTRLWHCVTAERDVGVGPAHWRQKMEMLLEFVFLGPGSSSSSAGLKSYFGRSVSRLLAGIGLGFLGRRQFFDRSPWWKGCPLPLGWGLRPNPKKKTTISSCYHHEWALTTFDGKLFCLGL